MVSCSTSLSGISTGSRANTRIFRLPSGSSPVACERLMGGRYMPTRTIVERKPVPASERSIELALVAAQAAADKKADDIVLLDVADTLVITDVFLVASAPNERQVLAITD